MVRAKKKLEINRLETEAKEADNKLKDQLLKIPNIPTATVPDGKSESDNIEIKNWGEKRNLDTRLVLPKKSPTTLFSRYGNIPFYFLIFILLEGGDCPILVTFFVFVSEIVSKFSSS